MKKISLLIVFVIGITATYAQSNVEEVDLYQSVFGMEKKAMVDYFVNPDEAYKDAFWNLYDEYELKRKANGKDRIKLLSQYAEQYNTISEEQAEALMTKFMKLQMVTDQLITEYYKKIKKVTSPKTAMRFWQMEQYILTVIRLELLENVPFVK